MDRLEEALEDYKAALVLQPNCREATDACKRLPKQIEESREKMKAEMFGNLKKLGKKGVWCVLQQVVVVVVSLSSIVAAAADMCIL